MHTEATTLLKRFTRILLAGALVALTWHSASAEEAATQPKNRVKLLTIGNSFADNASALLPKMAQAAGKNVAIFPANLGGRSLQQHADYLQAAEADPNSPAGRAYKGHIHPRTGAVQDFSLKEALESDAWDYVTIQQASPLSFQAETYQPYAGTLVKAVRQYAPTAEILVHETWAYREDSPMFRDGKLTQQAMHEKLKVAYEKLASEYGLRILPVGDAFQIARATPRWHFTYPDPDFDYKNPPAGGSPKQPGSLNTGWIWKKDKDGKTMFDVDAKHCNRAGQFLAAAVWYEVLFSENVESNTFVPEGMASEDAASLRKVAHQAVSAGKMAKTAH